MQRFRGLYRIRLSGQATDLVRVDMQGKLISLPENLYVDRNIAPPLKELGWDDFQNLPQNEH